MSGFLGGQVNWCMVFLFGQLFAALQRFYNGSWKVLLLGPVVLRLASGAWYLRYASIASARSQLSK